MPQLYEMIKDLLRPGFPGTQADLLAALRLRGITVTQSTVSRALNRLGAVRAKTAGQACYRLPAAEVEVGQLAAPAGLSALIASIRFNEAVMVVKTRPGTAMFLATRLDQLAHAGILGTIAGDDTIFIALAKDADPQRIRDLLIQFT